MKYITGLIKYSLLLSKYVHFSFFVTICLLLVSLTTVLFFHDTHAFRQTEYVVGSDTAGSATSCAALPNAFQGACPWPNLGGGGAGWRVFSVNDASGLDDYNGYGSNILSESLKKDVIHTCKSIGASYFFSYGWNGIAGSVFGYKNNNFQIGPANRYGLVGAQGTEYNTYNITTISKQVGNNKNNRVIDESKFKNNIRISLDDAELAYKTYGDKYQTGGIPEWVGAFCSKEDTDDDGYVQGKASVSEGPWSTSTNSATTGWRAKKDSDGTFAEIEIPKSKDEGVRVRYLIKLRAKGGDQTGQYTVSDTFLYPYEDMKLSSSIALNSSNTSGNHVLSYTYNGITKEGDWGYLDPGEKYCKYLYFKPNSDRKNMFLGACAHVRATEFYGYSTVRTDSSSYTPNLDKYKNTSGNDGDGTVSCVSSGCSVKFDHWIKTSNNLGSTKYFVNRNISNLSANNGGISAISTGVIDGSSPLKDSSKSLTAPQTSGTKVKRDALRLYPGAYVCEKLNFYNSNHYSDKRHVFREVCAFAKGDAYTYLNMKVRNDTLHPTDEKKYQSTAYAKPHDKVTFRASYDPQLQYAYSMTFDALQIDGKPTTPRYNNHRYNNGRFPLGSFFDAEKSSILRSENNTSSVNLGNWSNKFAVVGGDNVPFNRTYKYNAGDTTKRDEDNQRTITSGEVGKELKETAKTSNGPSGTTPKKITFDKCTENVTIREDTDRRHFTDLLLNRHDEQNVCTDYQLNKDNVERVQTIFDKETDDMKNAENQRKYEECLEEQSRRNSNSNWSWNNRNNSNDCSYIHPVSFSVSNIDTGSIESTANVIIPYNFKNTISVELSSDIFAAGETGSATATVNVGKKTNSLTTDGSEEQAYATKTDAKIRFVLFVPPANSNFEYKGGTFTGNNLCDRYSGMECYSKISYDSNNQEQISELNKNSNLSGYSDSIEDDFGIPDYNAGTKMCLAAAVYPATSGSDANLDPNGDGEWAVSDANCFTIYKKPSIQVWGGNVFSAGTLRTPLAGKRHIRNFNDFDISRSSVASAFGSFTELSLSSIGVVSGFASGAANGYSQNYSGSLTPSFRGEPSDPKMPGGFLDYNWRFEKMSRLTFANANKDGLAKDVAPGLGSNIAKSSSDNDRASLVSTFVNMSDDEATERSVTVLKKSSNYELNKDEFSFGNGQTIVIYAKDPNSNNYYDVTIRNNIEYPTEKYYDLSDIPKMIIFAKNINISCDVDRIDAVLIANSNVDTCYDGSKNDVNDERRSKQLIINGSVIANKLIADRTYGAATGSRSIVPAEIINYDTTLYLWGVKKADVTETGKLDTTYMRELAPKR